LGAVIAHQSNGILFVCFQEWERSESKQIHRVSNQIHSMLLSFAHHGIDGQVENVELCREPPDGNEVLYGVKFGIARQHCS